MDENTKLLLRFDDNFTDKSGNVADSNITNNNVVIDNNSIKFGSGSGSFNGTNSFISIPSQYLPAVSGDWTVDWWEYRTSVVVNSCILNATADGALNNDRGILIGYAANSSNLSFYATDNKAGWYIASGLSMGTVQLNQWVHRAVVKSGNNYYTFQNGVLQAQTSSTRVPLTPGVTNIGNYAGGLKFYNGLIDEFRISNIARWTANFTVPTEEDYKNNTPLYIKQKGFWIPAKKVYRKDNNSWTELDGDDVPSYITSSSILKPKYVWKKSVMAGVDSDESTLLLLKGNDLKDYSSNNFTIENHGVTQSDESQFGNGSLYFNGSSYLKISNPSVFEFGQDDPFTYEIWVKHDSPLPSKFFYFNGDTQGAFFWGFLTNWFTFGKNNIGYDVEGPIMDTSVLSQFYNWTYLKITHPCPAISKNTRELPETGNPGGTDLGVYINAAQVAAYSLSESFSLENGSLLIGAESSNGTVADYFKGYIEAIRISNVVRADTPIYYFGAKTELGYATSDNPNKYPSNGLAADGCYYERV